jgi:hypothetical protein
VDHLITRLEEGKCKCTNLSYDTTNVESKNVGFPKEGLLVIPTRNTPLNGYASNSKTSNDVQCSMIDETLYPTSNSKQVSTMLEAASSDSEQFRASNYLYKHSVYLVNTCKQENGSHERTTCPVLPTTNVPDGKTNAAFSW